jgi:hypothetical protein
LEDVLWDIDIKGISPGDDHDLANDSKKLSNRLIESFKSNLVPATLGAKLSQRLKYTIDDEEQTMQVSSGSWWAAKNVLLHVLTLRDQDPANNSMINSMIITGHSLGGGAAFLATLVLSCLGKKDIVCVSFGQPRVLVAPPPEETAKLWWHERKLIIMKCLSNTISKSNMHYHRILEETDPIPLIPTRFPASLGGRGERFVHVPDAGLRDQYGRVRGGEYNKEKQYGDFESDYPAKE